MINIPATIADVLENIPQSLYIAERYDDSDDMVLHLWNEEYDTDYYIRLNKSDNDKNNDIMHNRISIGYRDCIQVELESDELSFNDLKKETLELVHIIKTDLLKSDSKPNDNEVV